MYTPTKEEIPVILLAAGLLYAAGVWFVLACFHGVRSLKMPKRSSK